MARGHAFPVEAAGAVHAAKDRRGADTGHHPSTSTARHSVRNEKQSSDISAGTGQLQARLTREVAQEGQTWKMRDQWPARE